MYRGEVRLGLDSASLKFTSLRSENSLVGNPTPVRGEKNPALGPPKSAQGLGQ